MNSHRARRGPALAAATLASAVVLLGLFGLTACVSREPREPRAEQVFRARMREDPPDIDPVQSGDSLSDQVNFEIHDGLLGLDPASLEVVPAVAEAWEVSGDGLHYTFHLRGDVRFHNGRKTTADDVLYSFTRILDPKTNSKRREVLAAVKGAGPFSQGKTARVEGLEKVDPQTVRITLEEPLPHFLQLLTMAAASIVPREVYDDPQKGYLTHPVGCGPFQFSRWERSNFLELKAFGDYYRGRPKLDRVLFRFIENPASAMQEYRSGGLEWMDEFPGSETDIARDLPGDYRKGPYLASYFYGMNLARAPFKGNPALRKAFNYAVNKEAICAQTWEGAHTPAHGILPPGIPGYDPNLRGYPYDPARAREFLARAGYPEGKGLPEIDLWVNNNEKHVQAAQRVQADLKAAGIPVRIKAVDFATLLQGAGGTADSPGEALLYRFGWQADYPDPNAFLYPLLHSRNFGPAGNMGRYSNPKVDQLLDQARTMTRTDERTRLYREVERIAVEEDAVWLFTSNYTSRVLIKPYVKGVVLSPLGSNRIPLDRLWLEEPVGAGAEKR